MKKTRSRWWGAMACGAVLMTAVRVWAAPPEGGRVAEGVIVRVGNGEVIVDLGQESGLPSGAVVQVYRKVEVKHPVTGKVIVDRFPIGAMALSDVGRLLSIAREAESLTRAPAVGDFVVFEPKPGRAAAKPDAAEEEGVVVSRAPAQDAVEEVFAQTLGRPLTERIVLWENYLKRFPESPHLDQVGGELVWLRTELARSRESQVQSNPEPLLMLEPDRLGTRMSAPRVVKAGERVEVNVSVIERELAESVRVLWRQRGDLGYETVVMERSGDFNWRADLEAAAPGVLEIFAEVVRTNGTLQATSGAKATEPMAIEVEAPPGPGPGEGGRSRARTIVEFVDFKAGEGVDDFVRIESSFRYSIDRPVIKGFSAGVGIFQGEGGSLGEVERGETRRRNVNFGFAELELGLHEYFGVSGRVSVGNHFQTQDGTAEGIFGFRAEARIGEAEGTRLTLGAALTEDLGNEAWTALTLDVIEGWPITAGVTVTNLPVGGELGVSAELGVGYALTDWLALSLLTGWNARTINHYGFTAGAGALLTW